MADQHNDDIPAVGNQILADVADIEENLEFHKDVFQNFMDGWSNTDATAGTWLPPNAYYRRPVFSYNGGTTAYTYKVSGGEYMCKDKYCYWNSELTTTAVGSPTADTWYYLYLDYSAITSSTAITNSELVWSSTAPTFNHQYKGWYNGDDRCIFAVQTNSTPDNLIEMWHDGGSLLTYADSAADRAYDTISSGWASHALTLPDFGDGAKALVTFFCYDNSGNTYLYYRKEGSSASQGSLIARVLDAYFGNTVEVYVGSSQEVDLNPDGAMYLGIHTNGFFMPGGM